MIRDRLSELKQAGGEDKLDGGYVGPGGADTPPGMTVVDLEASATNPPYMERFFREVEEVRGGIAKLQELVDSVRRIHTEILSFGQPDEKSQLTLDDLTSEIKTTASKVRGQLKELERQTQTSEPEHQHSANSRMQRTQHVTLTKLFVQVMTEYNTVQANYRDRCKDKLQRQLKITGRDTTDEELDAMLEQGNFEVFTQGILTETQQAKQQLADIEARHQDIVKLEKSIKDLHDLFHEMAVMVAEQGDIVDHIESQVMMTQDYVETAKEQTGQAVQYQSKARQKKIMIIVCLGVVIGVLVLALVISLS